MKKTVFFASLGAGFEYYDFVLYALLAPILSTHFFVSPSIVKTLAIFGIAYVMRPLGGLLFGLVADIYGRKGALLSSLGLMAVATLIIGILPQGAAYLLLACRALQGLSLGAEMPAAVTLISEHSKKAFHTSFIISSVSMGSVLGTLLLFFLSSYLGESAMNAWGWRIPFLLGSLLAFVAYWMRKNVAETIVPSSALSSWQEVLSHLLQEKRSLAKGILITSATASLVLFTLYLPTYFMAEGIAPGKIYLWLTIATAYAALIVPLCGKIADLVGKRALFIASCLAFLCLAFPLFTFLSASKAPWFFLFAIQTFICLLSGSYLPLLANLFPQKVRCTGVACCYNVAFALMGFLPMAMALTSSPLFCLIPIILLSALAALSLSPRKKNDFSRLNQDV